MPGLSIRETEHQKERAALQDQALFQHIVNANKRKFSQKELVKKFQIIRFGNELVIALHRAPLKSGLLSHGSVGRIYSAHPIRNDGSINTKIVFMVKKIQNSAVKGSGSQPKYYDRTKVETENGNYVFSSRMTIIPQPQIKEGQTVYDTAIIMSKVSGVPLNIALHKGFLSKLSPPQALYLCITTISFFRILHQNQIFQGDIKAENFLINLEALSGVAVDLDPSHNTEETQAPEPEITALSDTYSIAKDILTPILIGIRGGNGSLAILLFPRFKGYHYEISDLLKGMQHPNPKERTTLAVAQETLEAILEKITKEPVATEKILEAQRLHMQQLRTLDSVLADSQYKPSPLYQIPGTLDISAAQPLSTQRCGFFSSAASSASAAIDSPSSVLKYPPGLNVNNSFRKTD